MKIYGEYLLTYFYIRAIISSVEIDSLKNRALVSVIRKCAAFSPNDRYKSARIVKSAFLRACKNKRKSKAIIGMLAVVIGFAFIGGFVLGRLTAPIPEIEQELENFDNSKMEEYAAEAVRLINIERANHGVYELLSDSRLNTLAMVRAMEVSEGYWQERPNGNRFDTDSEHKSAGQQSPQEYVNGLKGTDLWSELMDGSNIRIAIGVAEDSSGLLNWVLYVIGRGESQIDEIPD